MLLQKETMETISSAKCPFLNRDSVDYNADYPGEYADIRQRRFSEKLKNKFFVN